MMRAPAALAVTAAVALLSAPPAKAQRAQDNAITAAGDAFGTVVGNQTIGLYSATNARGFNPAQAQNVRIQGLYFDQQTSSVDPYLFRGTDMRVGISAQGYTFPSPTGIADLTLRTPGDVAAASVVIDHGPLNGYSVEADTQYPAIGDALSVGLNFAAARNFDRDYALESARRAISLVARIQLDAHTELIPFYGYVRNFERSQTPIVFSDRVHPLPLFEEQHLPTQSWTSWGWNQGTGGLIANVVTGGPWSVRAGLFRSEQHEARNFNDLWLGLTDDGLAGHVMDVTPAHTATSYSGDLRATRAVSDDTHRRELTFDVRSRHATRNYGGDSITDLGPISVRDYARLPEPALVFTDQSRDVVQQTGVGVSYGEHWSNRAALSLGILWTHYERSLDTPNLPSSSESTGKVLPAVSFAVNALQAITLYGSYTRGLEDSPSAPADAVNRGEPPPATPTWQVDSGVRVAFRPDLQLLLGAFEVHKSYFSFDTDDRYTQVGDIGARGIESSVTWTGIEGLTMVAGGVWLKPEVERKIAEQGATGAIPVGPVPRTLDLNVDYAPVGWRGWGAAIQWQSLSSRVETGDDLYRIPPLNTLNVGVRYTFQAFNRGFSTRLDVNNVTNATGLLLTSDYVAAPQLRRNYTLTFAADL
jgi:iron complex outermembrane receptor protein